MLLSALQGRWTAVEFPSSSTGTMPLRLWTKVATSGRQPGSSVLYHSTTTACAVNMSSVITSSKKAIFLPGLVCLSVSRITHLGGDKVSMLTHTYPHKPLRMIKVTICNHQADSPLYVKPNVCSSDLQV